MERLRIRAPGGIRAASGLELGVSGRETEIGAPIRPEIPSRRWDAAISELAGHQHGVIARRQLTEIGLTKKAIRGRLECGRLCLIHPGVYAVGHRNLSRFGKWMAAVLWGGKGATLSHRAAAALWQIRSGDHIEVTSPKQRKPKGRVNFHHSVLRADEITTEMGISTTTVPRTILDLAAILPRRQVEVAMNEADGKRLWDRLSLPDMLERYPRRRGTATIRAILADRSLGANVTDSQIEEDFLAFCAEYGLPKPETQVYIQLAGRWIRADVLFRAQRLIVELDGHPWHSTRETFESDRVRDRELAVLGWHVIRVTWRELHRNTASLGRDLRSLLARRAA